MEEGRLHEGRGISQNWETDEIIYFKRITWTGAGDECREGKLVTDYATDAASYREAIENGKAVKPLLTSKIAMGEKGGQFSNSGKMESNMDEHEKYGGESSGSGQKERDTVMTR